MGTLTTYAHLPPVCHKANDNQSTTIRELRAVIKELDECARCQRGSPGCGPGQRFSGKKSPLIVFPDQRMTNSRFGSYEKSHHTAPWKLPRYPSRELVGGQLRTICDCTRHNGMADKCRWLWCRGRPACAANPEPVCPPSGAWNRWVDIDEAARIMKIFDNERLTMSGGCQESKMCHDRCAACGGPITKDVIHGVNRKLSPPPNYDQFLLLKA